MYIPVFDLFQGSSLPATSGVGVLVATTPVPMIVASRAAVPLSLCDISVTICDRNLTATIIHLGLVAVLTVDGSCLRPNMITPQICTKQYKIGDEIELFALDDQEQLVQKCTRIRDIDAIVTGACSPPRWHITNTEGITLLDYVHSGEGLLIDPGEKSVVALWTSVDFQAKTGLNYEHYVRPVVEKLRNGEKFQQRCCGWAFGNMALPLALQVGLDDKRAVRMAALAHEIHATARPIVVAGKLRPPAVESLKVGDIVLEINGVPVVRMADVRILSQVESAEILVLRNRKEISVTLYPQLLPSELTSSIICWAGAVFHQTHDSVLEQLAPEFFDVSKREGIVDPGTSVYISCINTGSPAINHLQPTYWILEVDETKVKTMADMADIIRNLNSEKEYIRVKMIESRGITSVVSVRLDSTFWPAWMLEMKNNKWVRTELLAA